MAAPCTPAPTDLVKVVGICGSLRDASLTKKALEIALAGASDALAEVELIDLSTYRLYFCDGLAHESKNARSVPNDVDKLKAAVKSAHGLILATPEYHGSFSGVLKNALDLMGFEEMEGKIVGLVSVSGGALGGVNAVNGLREVCRALHTWTIPQQACVPQAWRSLGSPDMQTRIRKVGTEVAKYAYLHANKRAQEFLDQIQKAAENPGAAGKNEL